MQKKTKQLTSLILSFLLLISLLPGPSLAQSSIGIEKNIKAYYVGEEDLGQELLDYHADETLAIASLTKIMTYIVTMDKVRSGEISLDDQITITEEDAAIPGSSMDLKAEEVLTVRDLLKGLMIVSGNDAAYVLARYVAGTEEQFVSLMNQKAEDLHLTSYQFHNASGYPYNGIDNMMSSKDLFIMTKYCLDTYPEVLEMTKQAFLDMPEREFRKETTIPLIGEIPTLDGFKTGTTDAAGNCLIATFEVPAEREEDSFRVIAVMMGMETKELRVKMARYIIDYVMKNFAYQQVLDPQKPFMTLQTNRVGKGEIVLYPEKGVRLLTGKDQGFHIEESLVSSIDSPIKQGESLGQITIESTNAETETIDLVTKSSYSLADKNLRLKRTVQHALKLVRNLLYI